MDKVLTIHCYCLQANIQRKMEEMSTLKAEMEAQSEGVMKAVSKRVDEKSLLLAKLSGALEAKNEDLKVLMSSFRTRQHLFGMFQSYEYSVACAGRR